MNKFINLEGKRFGKLVVTSQDFAKRGQAYWNCQCDCGRTKSVASASLRNGSQVSCGCYRDALHAPMAGGRDDRLVTMKDRPR